MTSREEAKPLPNRKNGSNSDLHAEWVRTMTEAGHRPADLVAEVSAASNPARGLVMGRRAP